MDAEETQKKKIAHVIEHQFDLEILLRHAEKTAVQHELDLAEKMLEDLRHAILSERQGAPYGNSTLSRQLGVLQQQQLGFSVSRHGTRRANANYNLNQRIPETLYAVRADGQFVKLGCPTCARYDFGSSQGLLNHMRIQHKLVFKSTEEGVRYCGVVVPSSEVPSDHPCRSKVVFSSIGMELEHLEGSQTGPKPTIKTYDEHVDLDLEGDHSKYKSLSASESRQRTTSINESSNAGSGSDSEADTPNGDSRRRRSSLSLRALGSGLEKSRRNSSSQGDNSSGSSESSSEEDAAEKGGRRPSSGKGPMRKYGASTGSTITEPNRKPWQPPNEREMSNQTRAPSPPKFAERPISMQSSAASSRATSPNIHPFATMEEYMSDISPSPAPAPHPAVPAPPAPLELNAPLTKTASATTQSLDVKQPNIIAFGASAIQPGILPALDTQGSRFHVKRRIVVGNVSKFIPPEKRDPRLKNFSHRWKIYVDGMPNSEDISSYVSHVSYQLHETYKPSDLFEVTEPPFHLGRYAWGETQIKATIFFSDKVNKPVEVYHMLALDPTNCGKQVLGRERFIDLELDRNTVFTPVKPWKSGRASQAQNKDTERVLEASGVRSGANSSTEDDDSAASSLHGDAALTSTINLHSNSSVITLNKSKGPVTPAGLGINRTITHAPTALSTTSTISSSASTLTPSSSVPSSYSSSLPTSVTTNALSAALKAAAMAEEPPLLPKEPSIPSSLEYCKACGSLWEQHREATKLANGFLPVYQEKHPACVHHPEFLDIQRGGLLGQASSATGGTNTPFPILGRTKDKFALDMLKDCGIMDAQGFPTLVSQRQQQQQQQQQPQMSDSETRTRLERIKELLPQVHSSSRSDIDWVVSVLDELKMRTLALDDGQKARQSLILQRQQQQQQPQLAQEQQESVDPAHTQRAMVGGLLVQLTKVFLKSILTKSIDIYRTEAEAEKAPEDIMMDIDLLNDDGDVSTSSATGVMVSGTNGNSDSVNKDDQVEQSGQKSGSNSNDSLSRDAKVTSKKLLVPYHIFQVLQTRPDELDFLTTQFEDMTGIGMS